MKLLKVEDFEKEIAVKSDDWGDIYIGDVMEILDKHTFNWKCFLGLHLWYKGRFSSGAKIQSYAFKVCERCGIEGSGYAKRNHPFFRKVLGLKDK